MSDEKSFDMIVIGAGPGGYVCAIRAAQLGLKVACVESRETLGGTCLNVGCIPSKALLESSHHYYHVQHGLKNHGIEVKSASFDLKKMISRKDEVVKSITGGVEFLFKKNKITWLKGLGVLTAERKVRVGQETYSAKHVVIATGSKPIELAQAPFDHKIVTDSTDALCFEKVPKHLIVIGGGVIGLELGSVWARLGAKVTVIEASAKILGNTDRGISSALERLLVAQGLEIHLGTALESCEVTKSGEALVTCKKGEEKVTFKGDKVIVAVGRRPNFEGLGLKEAGVLLDERGRAKVDAHYATNVPGVYAIGDVISGPMLAHKAEEEGIALAELLCGKAGHVNYKAIPSVVYTWPEVACIGLSEEECKEKGLSVKVGKFNFKANGRAKAMDATDGFAKAIADAKTDELLGFHIVGPMASELIAEVAIAFEYGASAEDIARSVHAHPTLAEVLKETALDVHKQAIHA